MNSTIKPGRVYARTNVGTNLTSAVENDRNVRIFARSAFHGSRYPPINRITSQKQQKKTEHTANDTSQDCLVSRLSSSRVGSVQFRSGQVRSGHLLTLRRRRYRWSRSRQEQTAEVGPLGLCCTVLFYFSLTHQVEEELAPGAVVEHEEELVPCLEGHVEAHYEGVLDVAEHVPFGLGVLHLQVIHASQVVLRQASCNDQSYCVATRHTFMGHLPMNSTPAMVSLSREVNDRQKLSSRIRVRLG